ncbi:alpha-hydroxy-acid oxidizing protein [Pseudomonas alkylphenolica]|uniref:(S)-2-hydroxy-acid oxidase n=1 Tax=Pseudomonas alkylphenolica TaxID=237609 RepID=A0A077FA65_9PSED|nr:alpha-hydroxy-acid oxidizing protein [Pseudomonas alkylphenolica]AIL62332.1 (S)-2-hydroxy-acid oxidase [Pseudomonas alkylphenolica]
MGANAVAIGRPVMFGLALEGASGVDSVIDYLHRETVNTLLHLGANNLGELRSEHVRPAAAPGTYEPLSVGAERLG